MKDPWDFSGRAAVVTGGARGIGRCIGEELLKRGAEVHIFDNAPGMAGGSGDFHYQQVDVSDAAGVTTAVAGLPDNANLLVNNAGITRDRTLMKMNDEEWRSVIGVNLSGAFYVTRAMAPRMRAAGGGRVVNISSINALRGKFGQANYAAAKAGLIGLTKTSARELGPKNVTVNAIAPGLVLTEMTLQMPEEIRYKAMEEIVLNRPAEPRDIAYAVLFLLSDAAAMITGEVIRVDGGQCI